MRVICPTCGKPFNDYNSWTICPHNPLNVAHDAVYCRRCDIFVGYTNIFTRSDKPDNCVACGRSSQEILNARA